MIGKTFSASVLCFSLMLVTLQPSAAELDESAFRDIYDAWSTADIDKLMGYFSDDIVYSDVPMGTRNEGTEAVRAFAMAFFKNYAGVKLLPASITVGTNSAAVEWVMSGGTGDEAWSIPGVCVFEMKDGKITRATDYWDKE
ncbi:MAG: nuclear transport factor 2 family protein [Pseudomonadota bacterium]